MAEIDLAPAFNAAIQVVRRLVGVPDGKVDASFIGALLVATAIVGAGAIIAAEISNLATAIRNKG